MARRRKGASGSGRRTGSRSAIATRRKTAAAGKSTRKPAGRKKAVAKKPVAKKPAAKKPATASKTGKSAAGRSKAGKSTRAKAKPARRKAAGAKTTASARTSKPAQAKLRKPRTRKPAAAKRRTPSLAQGARKPAATGKPSGGRARGQATTGKTKTAKTRPVHAARGGMPHAATRPAPRRPAAQRTSTGKQSLGHRSATGPRRDPRQPASRKLAPRRPKGQPFREAAREAAPLLDRLDELIARARRAGADAADAVTFESASLVQAVRLGEPETLERSESRDLGLRVFLGRRQAVVSSADFSNEAMNELVERAMAMVRAVPEDRFCGLADPDAVARRIPDLDLLDPVEPTPQALLARALACEDAARSVAGITNSNGADASWGRSLVALAASNGFAGSFARSHHGHSVSVVAGSGTAMERDHDFSSAVFAAGLERPETVGRRAAERTLRRLNPRKIASATMPVVFDRRVAGGLIGHIAGAVNGSAIARGTSFLKDAMGSALLPEKLSLIDDPTRRRGLASMPFDGEGVATRKLAIVDRGRLASWILDLGTARQLGLSTTGHAQRGTSSAPSPATSNLYLDGGIGSVDALIADISRGLYVTDLMGFGVNLVTGDYSRGAAGFLIENGKLGHPVSEVTIAGHLKEMLATLAAAGDLEFRHGTNAPTLRIERMAIGGN